jgi:hypothetical protein
MNAFDELQRQLAESVAARGRSGGAGGLWRWWRGRSLPVATALMLGALVAAATLATRTGANRPAAPASPLLTASATGGSCDPCRVMDGRLHGPLSVESAFGGAVSSRTAVRRGMRRGLPFTIRWASPVGAPAQAGTAPVG